MTEKRKITGKQSVLEVNGQERGRPDFIARMPIEKGRWMTVGRAYFNPKKETIIIYFDVIPDMCKVVMFKD